MASQTLQNVETAKLIARKRACAEQQEYVVYRYKLKDGLGQVHLSFDCCSRFLWDSYKRLSGPNPYNATLVCVIPPPPFALVSKGK